jgi:quinol monooxygenase YgiN
MSVTHATTNADISETDALRGTDKPITVLCRFHLRPRDRESWSAIWGSLEQYASTLSACTSFHRFYDEQDEASAYVISEWLDAEAFHYFVRKAALAWIERVHPGLGMPRDFVVLGSDEAPATESIDG